MLVYDTYRWREHCGPNYDNDLGYRSEQEFLEWRKLCPIEALQKQLIADGVLSNEQNDALNREFKEEVDAAFEHAKQAPFPKIETVERWLYA